MGCWGTRQGAWNKKDSALWRGEGRLEEVSGILEEGKDLARLMAAEERARARRSGRRERRDRG